MKSSGSYVSTQRDIFTSLDSCLDKVRFPSLTTVHVYGTDPYRDDAAVERQRIRKHGISVYFTYCKNPRINRD